MSFEANKSWVDLIEEMKRGSVRALSRLITNVENKRAGWIEAMAHLGRNSGEASIIGITGTPGTGKSTLIARLASELIRDNNRVGIVAVDPSSPFSGGAILGDRLRMQSISSNEKVFVRSMATRGTLGGLNDSVRDVVKVLDAFGKDIIIIETVGVGQDEVEIVKIADVVVVVCVSGQGDEFQAMKSGLMEIADIFVVNKADKEGAEQVVMDIQTMLQLSHDERCLETPIVKTSASDGEGIHSLIDTILREVSIRKAQPKHQKTRVKEELLSILEQEIKDTLRSKLEETGIMDAMIRDILDGKSSSYSIVSELTKHMTGSVQEFLLDQTGEKVR